MAERQEDPIVSRARFEAWVGMLIWLACLVYSVTVCYLFGYNRSIDSLTFVLGLPDWIYWGLVAPWFLCCMLSIWLAFRFIKDADLGEDKDEEADL